MKLHTIYFSMALLVCMGFSPMGISQSNIDLSELDLIESGLPPEAERMKQFNAAVDRTLKTNAAEKEEIRNDPAFQKKAIVKFQPHVWGSFLNSAWKDMIIDSRILRRDVMPFCSGSRILPDYNYRKLGYFLSEEAMRLRQIYEDSVPAEQKGIEAAKATIHLHAIQKEYDTIKSMDLSRVKYWVTRLGTTTEELISPARSQNLQNRLDTQKLTTNEQIEIVALQRHGPYVVDSPNSLIVRDNLEKAYEKNKKEIEFANFFNPARSNLANAIMQNGYEIQMHNHNSTLVAGMSTGEKVTLAAWKVGTALFFGAYTKVIQPAATTVTGKIVKNTFGILIFKNPTGALGKSLWNLLPIGGGAVTQWILPSVPRYLAAQAIIDGLKGDTVEAVSLLRFSSVMSGYQARTFASDYLTQMENLCDMMVCYKHQTQLKVSNGATDLGLFSSDAPSGYRADLGKFSSHDQWIQFCASARQEIARKKQELAASQTYLSMTKELLQMWFPRWFGEKPK